VDLPPVGLDRREDINAYPEEAAVVELDVQVPRPPRAGAALREPAVVVDAVLDQSADRPTGYRPGPFGRDNLTR
jgi:hypothetical protein